MPFDMAQDRLFGERAACLSGLAAQVLGWRPDEFWAATPAELAWAMRDGDDRVEPVSADEMTELLVRFPDGVR